MLFLITFENKQEIYIVLKRLIAISNLFLFSLILCNCFPSFSQQQQIDSLLSIANKSKSDSNKVNVLNTISRSYFSTEPNKSIEFGIKARDLATKINFQKGIAFANKNIGIAYYMQSKNIEAIQTWNKAMEIFKNIGDKTGQANILSNIGALYFNQAEDTKAIENYLQSLKIAEELNDSLRIATVLSNIGSVYLNKKATYDKALDYFNRALPICESLKDNNELGTVFVNIGETYYKKGEAKKALEYFKKSLEVYHESENIPYSYIYIGKVYAESGDYDNAIKNQFLAYKIAKKLDGKLDIARALVGLASTYKLKSEHITAIKYFLEGIPIAKEIKANIELKDLYQGLSESYKSVSDYSNAYKYQSLLLGIKDTLYNNETDKKLGSIVFNFEIEKKEGKIKLLTKDKKIQEEVIHRQKIIRNTFIIGFAIVIIFAGVFFKQRNKIKKEKHRSEELLLNILPEETAEELKNTGQAKAKSFDSVTVLFTDFKDFTKLSEVLTPKQLVNEINECFSAFDKIMTKYGIEKIKTIGDAYMAAGGLPTTNETHPQDVVKAALDIRDFMIEHKAKKEAAGELFFRIRIGVHTGPVVAGIVGIKKFAYDIWGDTVNTASRMESSGDVGKVNVSGTTYQLIKDHFTCTYRGKLAAKNKGEIDMYFVEEEIHNHS
jgi:class 3 adenylate cyclase/Tfp pilus assembly protein PilF